MNNELEEYETNGSLIKCNTCGRSFNENAIDKHTKICLKVFVKKRKVFNAKDQRKNEELQEMEMKSKSNVRKKKNVTSSIQHNNDNDMEKPVNKIPKWKMQSEMLRKALGKSKPTNDGFGGVEQYEEQDTRVQCKFCNRKFNEDRFDKH